jgi:oxygen-dependent protoporphyrinogen oxidase
MPSQLPEHAVVSLIRHCFLTPRCQAPRLRQQTFSKSSAKAYYRVWAGRDISRAETSRAENQQRCYYTQSRAADESEASCQANSSGLSLAQRQDFQSPVLAKQHSKRSSQGSRPQSTKRIAVLGGGITGLSSAHYLTRELPNAQITIYESEDKLGGWLQSKYVNVRNGKILFEQGPRTLRPSTASALATVEMVR